MPHPVLYLNYIIIICINNNAVIDNNYEELQEFILSFKILTDTQRICSKCIENLGRRPPNYSPARCV